MLNFLALIGAVLVAVAYLPQIGHLIRLHCAYGINTKAWFIWLIASLLIFPYALTTGDKIFIILQSINITAITFILIFSYLHQGKECGEHKIL